MFEKFIGQETVKKKLSYWIESHNKGYPMPVMLFVGAKGHGKTAFAEESFQYYLGENGKKKPHCVVNCSQFSDANQFFEEFILKIQGKEMVCLLDEAHTLPKNLQEALLTPFNPNGETLKSILWNGNLYKIDLNKQVFVFATTEPNKILKPLLERFKKVSFSRYSDDEIGRMILKKTEDEILIEEDLLGLIAETCRKSPRLATDMTDEIKRFCSFKDEIVFDKKMWEEFSDIMGIKRFGLDENELEVLKVLNERGECSLSEVASALNMTSLSIRKSVEDYLLNMRFIEIDGKRRITQKGKQALKKIKRSY